MITTSRRNVLKKSGATLSVFTCHEKCSGKVNQIMCFSFNQWIYLHPIPFTYRIKQTPYPFPLNGTDKNSWFNKML